MISHTVCSCSDIVTVWWSLVKRNNIVIWFLTFTLPETIPPVVCSFICVWLWASVSVWDMTPQEKVSCTIVSMVTAQVLPPPPPSPTLSVKGRGMCLILLTHEDRYSVTNYLIHLCWCVSGCGSLFKYISIKLRRLCLYFGCIAACLSLCLFTRLCFVKVVCHTFGFPKVTWDRQTH